jgi:hypothetical protein
LITKIAVFVFKAVLVAFVATCISGLPVAILLTWGMRPDYVANAVLSCLYISALGNFVIGLPIALAVFPFARGDLRLAKLVVIANVFGMAFVALVTAQGDFFVTLFYGIPILLAANTFAVVGWRLIIRPTYQTLEHAPAK